MSEAPHKPNDADAQLDAEIAALDDALRGDNEIEAQEIAWDLWLAADLRSGDEVF